MGLLSPPLKSVIPFFAQATNHPLPSDLKYADGTTLGAGTHGIAGGSSPYILPDLRGKFLLGADRTKDLFDAGQYIAFISSMTASGNSFNYQTIQNNLNYTVVSGDILQYDVYWPSGSIPSTGGCGAVDLTATDGSALRTIAPLDQNGLSQHPATDLRAYALNQWYTRRISLASWIGKIINGFILAHEYDGTFANLTSRFQNLYITDASGNVKHKGWQSGDGTPTYAAHVVTSATFISGNATTLGAPGPEGVAGTHQQRLRSPNIPNHGHTASSGLAGNHVHDVSITGHGAHTHGADNGSNFVRTTGIGGAMNGATYYYVSCAMGVTSSNGSHSHTVGMINEGNHGHNVFVQTASSGGVNAQSAAFDPRPRYYGMVFTIKAGGSNRLLSVPLGTAMYYYADVQNETLPTGYSYLDGSSLTAGNHTVPNAVGSMSYTLVLPDLRNRFLIGADRTLTIGAAGSTTDGPSGAPGPGRASGVHSFSFTVSNLPDHGHTASSDAQWSTHNHTWTIIANSDHGHGEVPAWYLTSTNGATVGLSGLGAGESYMAEGVAGATTTDDSHQHTASVGPAGSHSHTITVNSTGSGTAFDNRAPFVGVVMIMKTGTGMLSVPLKVLVALRVTSVNEALPSDWAYCDGTVLTAPQQDINPGSTYTLPDLRNFHLLGADRTKVAGNAGALTDTAADAPGPKGTGGGHTVTMTTSTMPAHIHAGSSDVQGSHNHGGGNFTDFGGGHGHSTGCHTWFATTSGTLHTHGNAYTQSPYDVGTYSNTLPVAATQPDHAIVASTDGNHTHAITVSNFGSGSAFAKRPRFHGVVWIMKVKH